MRVRDISIKEGSDLLVLASVDSRRYWQRTIIGSEIGSGVFLNVGYFMWQWAPSPRDEGGDIPSPLM